MSLILIHPDYQKGSSLCPVCNVTKGAIRQDNFKLCIDCYKAAAGQNPEKEMNQISRINSLFRGVSLLICMTAVILFGIGYGISYRGKEFFASSV
jgi:hypothetical protein